MLDLISLNPHPFSPLLAQWGGNSTPNHCRQEHRTASPSSYQPAGYFTGRSRTLALLIFPQLYCCWRQVPSERSQEVKAPFFYPAFIYGTEALPWEWHCWESWGPRHECPGLYRGFHVKRGKLERPGEVASHLRSTPRADFAWGKKKAKEQRAPKPSPKELTLFAMECEEI